MTLEEFRADLRAACAEAGSQLAWSRQTGVSTPYISDVLSGRREPGQKLLDALDMDKVVDYRRRNRKP
jgi:hypothetical protein